MIEKTSNNKLSVILKSSVIAMYLVVLGWLLFVVFNTKSLSNSSLIIQYSSITIALLILFKVSSDEEVSKTS